MALYQQPVAEAATEKGYCQVIQATPGKDFEQSGNSSDADRDTDDHAATDRNHPQAQAKPEDSRNLKDTLTVLQVF